MLHFQRDQNPRQQDRHGNAQQNANIRGKGRRIDSRAVLRPGLSPLPLRKPVSAALSPTEMVQVSPSSSSGVLMTMEEKAQGIVSIPSALPFMFARCSLS